MSGRVGINKRIVETIAIPVQRLRIVNMGYYAVRSDEPPNNRIIHPRIIIIESAFGIELLVRKEFDKFS